MNKILNGDCLELMKDIPDASIDLTVTSPPYDNLRTYNDSLIWNENIWKEVIKDLFRVTKDGGVVVWVVGDATIKGSETGTSFKQALWAMECGFNLHDTMIYQKSTPPLTHNRYEQNFEFMFILSKGKLKTFNGLREPREYPDNRVKKAFGKNKNDSVDIGYSSKDTTRLKRNVWKYFAGGGANDKIASNHPAIFPEQLAQDHILSWSNEGDLILDPFGGSGTTGIASLNTNRNYILIEKEENYFEIIKKRISDWHKDKEQRLF